MKHIDFDALYHLAGLVIEDAPLEDNQIEQMYHISECKTCYDEFCSIIAILEATNETGMIAIRHILRDRIKSSEENVGKKILAVISVKAKMIREKISVVMEQLQDDVSSLCFEAPLAMAARSTDSDIVPKVSKLEDIENERTFILFDSESRILYIQLDVRDLESDNFSVYLVMSNGEKRMIPLSRDGNLLKSTIENITDTDFKILITQ